MNPLHLFSSVLNWVLGLLGMFALLAGLGFMPTLFGYENADQIFWVMGDVTLYKGILGFFNYTFAIAVLVVSTALFVWIGLLFSMSFHTMIDAIGDFFSQDGEQVHMAAWVVVLVANFLMVAQFVYILFGMILTPTTLLVGGLMIAAMCTLLFANYREVSSI